MATFHIDGNGTVREGGTPIETERRDEWLVFPLIVMGASDEETYTIEWSQNSATQNQHGGFYVDAPNLSPRTGGPTWWWHEGMQKWSPNNVDVLDGVSEEYRLSHTLLFKINSKSEFSMMTDSSGVLTEYEYKYTPSSGLRLMYKFNPEFTSNHRLSVKSNDTDVWERLTRVESVIEKITSQDKEIETLIEQGYTYEGGDLHLWSGKFQKCIEAIMKVAEVKEVGSVNCIAELRHAIEKRRYAMQKEFDELKEAIDVIGSYPQLQAMNSESKTILAGKSERVLTMTTDIDKCVRDFEKFTHLFECVAMSSVYKDNEHRKVTRNYNGTVLFK